MTLKKRNVTMVGNGTQLDGTAKSSRFLHSSRWALEPMKLRPATVNILKNAFGIDDAEKVTSEPHDTYTLETVPAQ